jgi:hypothetical protein
MRLAAFNRAQSCCDLIPGDLTHAFVEEVARTRDVSIGRGGSNLHWRVEGVVVLESLNLSSDPLRKASVVLAAFATNLATMPFFL